MPEEVGAQWRAKSGTKVVREQGVSGEGHVDSKRWSGAWVWSEKTLRMLPSEWPRSEPLGQVSK